MSWRPEASVTYAPSADGEHCKLKPETVGTGSRTYAGSGVVLTRDPNRATVGGTRAQGLAARVTEARAHDWE